MTQISDFRFALLKADEALNDSDKTFVVPAKRTWEILSIRAELISTATVGNRTLFVEFQDDVGDIIFDIRHPVTQAASLTRFYHFAPDAPELDPPAFRVTDWLALKIPRLILPTGFIVRVFDAAVIDVAADDLTLQMMVVESG